MSLILIDKPEGPTSHAVVATIKRALSAEKVGHLGTLDPFASGLLPILIGNTARLSDEAMDGKKGYLFTIGFGRETDTLDPTGRVIAEAALPSSDVLSSLDTVLNSFRGSIEQVPPVYSALKMNGMPLYEYMRATGKLPVDIESKRRTVTIHSIEIVETSPEHLALRVICSKGTYVRSLARDIAKAMGSVGTCIQLRREMVEPWDVKNALKLSIAENGKIVSPDKELLLNRMLPPWSVAPTLPRGQIARDLESRLLSGNSLTLHSDDVHWDYTGKDGRVDSTANSLKLPQHIEADLEPLKIFISSGTTLFLCEAHVPESGTWKIQPRKRIQ